MIGFLIPSALFLGFAFMMASVAFSLRERKFQKIQVHSGI